MKKIRVLIGSCGGLTGLYLSKYFYNNREDLEIYGFDVSEDIVTKKYLKDLFTAPVLLDEERFLEFFINLVKEKKIDLYFPTYSSETLLISKYNDYILKECDIKFIVSPYDTANILENKDLAYIELSKIGIDCPEIYNSVENVKYPAFIKPKYGSGSKNSFIIKDKIEYNFFSQKYNDSVIMEFIEGDEYTVDAVFDYNGGLISYNQRKRLKTLGGAVVVTQNCYDVDCKSEIELIASEFLIRGVANFQFFYSNGKKIFTDINLRFASGGLPLSVESGVNIPEILLKLLMNIDFNYNDYLSDRKKRTMYRYFEEYFEVN